MASNSHKSTVKRYLKTHKESTGHVTASNKGKTGPGLQPSAKRSGKQPSDPKQKPPAQSPHSSRSSQRQAYLQNRASSLRINSKGGTKLEYMPDELLIEIFGNLGPRDLLVASRVCRRWLELTSDNLLWQKIYHKYRKKKKGEKPLIVPSHIPPCYWKKMCLKNGGTDAKAPKVQSLLKKLHPFTGLPVNTQKALQQLGTKFLVVFVDNDNMEHVFQHNDIFHFTMSLCTRFYGLTIPAIHRVKKLRIYAANPVFFNDNGTAVSNSPCKRSLLYETDFKWGQYKTNNPPASSDDAVDTFILPHGLLVATWKADGDMAFITASFHARHLVERCLKGTSDSVYQPPPHRPIPDDIDPKYGLHGYSCTLELRNQRTHFWSQQCSNLYVKEGNIGGGFAKLILIDPDDSYDRSTLGGKKITMPWKTDLFKGIVPNMCFLDMTLLDERSTPMWCTSSAVKVCTPHNTKVDYDFSGDNFEIEYSDACGKVVVKFVWEPEDRQYFVTGLLIYLAVPFINAWFARRY